MKVRCFRKCLQCKDSFIPSPNNRATQRYCAKAECRQASRTAARRKWLRKAENRSYFRGAENVARVQRWRKANPGYWRKKKPPLQDALQDLAHTQVSPVQGAVVHGRDVSRADSSACEPSAASHPTPLQDLATIQVPLLAGLISLLAGDALQDRFALFARDLVERGQRVLGRQPHMGRFATPVEST